MFEAILMAYGLTLSLTLATATEAKLENTIDDVPPPPARSVVPSFTDPVDVDRSKVGVFTSSGREITTGALHTNGEGTDLIAPINTPLSPGTYKVLWRAASREGHVASGMSELNLPLERVSRASQVSGPLRQADPSDNSFQRA